MHVNVTLTTQIGCCQATIMNRNILFVLLMLYWICIPKYITINVNVILDMYTEIYNY